MYEKLLKVATAIQIVFICVSNSFLACSLMVKRNLLPMKLLWSCFFCFVALSAQSQDAAIELTNPSFEDFPRPSQPPRGWYDCGASNETPPDVHPESGEGAFKVTLEAQEQLTYLGLVVRDNDTWEAVSQRLKAPLKKGKCYSFSIHVARSIIYESQSRTTKEPANYATPAKLRIWAGNNYCDKAELLGETKEIINTRWLKREFKFEPKGDYYYIIFEAFYKTPVLFPYNGNILLDNASSLQVIPCTERVLVQKEDTVPPPVSTVTSGTTTPKPTPPVSKDPVVVVPPPKPTEEATISGVKRAELKTGQTIIMENLYFEADKSLIQSGSYFVLDDLSKFLKENKDVVIEIGGHTNGLPEERFCDSLSNERAKTVAEYLRSKGVQPSQLTYKGYGKRKLIAKDDSLEGRRRNQRVEIKILSFG